MQVKLSTERQEYTMQEQQEFNEALTKLCILLYQIDGKITLREQEYFRAVHEKFDWHGEVDFEDFQSRAISQVRDVIQSKEEKRFVSSLREALELDAKKALAVAQGISNIDGELADEEMEILDYLQERVLAKALN